MTLNLTGEEFRDRAVSQNRAWQPFGRLPRYVLPADGQDVVVTVGRDDPPARYVLAGVAAGSIVVIGPGYGDAVRRGDGPGHAIRDGAGDGGANRLDGGPGHAIRVGSGDGWAYRVGVGTGHAIRDGDGPGTAHRAGPGAGSAWRAGIGAGTAFRAGDGPGLALATGGTGGASGVIVTPVVPDAERERALRAALRLDARDPRVESTRTSGAVWAAIDRIAARDGLDPHRLWDGDGWTLPRLLDLVAFATDDGRCPPDDLFWGDLPLLVDVDAMAAATV